MTKKVFISMLGSFAIAAMLLVSPAVTATNNSVSTYQVDEGGCDKCGKKDCKGCEKKEAKAEGEKKACTSKGEGKSCCAHGSKKEVKAEEKKK